MLSLGGKLHMATSQDRFWNRKAVGSVANKSAQRRNRTQTPPVVLQLKEEPSHALRSVRSHSFPLGGRRLRPRITLRQRASVRPGIARGSGVGDQDRIVCG